MSDVCKNCGGWRGIHHYLTMQCPVGGVEAPIHRKQEYMDCTYQEQDDDLDILKAEVKELRRKVDNLLKMFPSADIKAE